MTCSLDDLNGTQDGLLGLDEATMASITAFSRTGL
jgi:hypothetical protein